MDKAVVVAPSSQVQGDITQCKIENTLKSYKIDSAFSITGQSTYITYDVCNKTVLSEYINPEITLFGAIVVIIVGGFVVCIVGAIISRIFDYLS